MRIFGIRIPFTKETDTNLITPIGPTYSMPSPFGVIVESFGGMWQRNLQINDAQNALSQSATFACVSLISGDIAKLTFRLMREKTDGTLESFESPAFSPVIRKPNRYQTAQQFYEQWLLSKLIWGNTYCLQERDNRGIVVAQYILDPQRVKPLIAPDGEIFYQVNEDRLAGVGDGGMIFPASEIIHDRGKCLFHPLIGVPPLYACALSTTQSKKIQVNSSKFFENMSRPSGQLTAPGTISEDTARRLKAEFESGFSGANLGKLLVSGDGLKFEPFTIPADQAQLVEQLGWTVEDVARAYLVPLYKISAQKDVKVDPAMRQEYYDTVLHPYMNAIESLQAEGLRLPSKIWALFDVDELLRLDPVARYNKLETGIKAGILSPNEARLSENYSNVVGGESPYLQQQNYSLAALAKRDAQADPVGAPVSEDVTEEMATFVLRRIEEGLRCVT